MMNQLTNSIRAGSKPSTWILAIILGLLLGTWGCSHNNTVANGKDDGLTDPCEGVDCGPHGQCIDVGGGMVVCMCEQGYHSDGLSCVENDPGDPCEGVKCSNHGHCEVVDGNPICVCDDGYHRVGDTNCVPDETPDPDAGVDAGPDAGPCIPQTEICDGIDNDCDSLVMERTSDLFVVGRVSTC